MDAGALDVWAKLQLVLYGGYSWCAVVIRHGYLVREIATFNVLASATFDIWSGTKSFTSTAWGLLLEGPVPFVGGRTPSMTLQSRIYDFIPEGDPLTDLRKRDITVGQVLSMTSGIKGEAWGVVGTPTAIDAGPFEHALGKAPNRSGVSVSELATDPGTRWDYSDPAFCHLSLAFCHAAEREIADVVQEHVFQPIGIEHAHWDPQGGRGFLGPHTNAHTGLHMSARELARFGYMALRGGRWGELQVVPPEWQAKATRPSQEYNPSYGFGWWTNARGRFAPGLPSDLVAASGFGGNRCYIIPSLDLVVARVGTGPFVLDERAFLEPVIAAVSR
jgi:CubicO group peptidase (beta-lactamase class C family)